MDIQQTVLNVLSQQSVKTVILAYSGGLDSTVLLHALSQQQNYPVKAVHVNHHLQTAAMSFEKQCQANCAEYGVPLEVVWLELDTQGQSIEAVARRARYAALKPYIQSHCALLTGQHQQDQAETFLLQALRGSGVRGLVAMPLSKSFGDGVLLRPLLDVPQAALKAYAKTHQLTWSEDPSNAQTTLDRNFLRHNVLPVLRARWPSANETLSRVTNNLTETLQLQEDLAVLDFQSLVVEDDFVKHVSNIKSAMNLEALLTLPVYRQKNVLRYWIQDNHVILPSKVKLETLCLQLTAKEDSNPEVHWLGASVRRYRETLYLFSSSETDFVFNPNQHPALSQLTIAKQQDGQRCHLRGETHSRRLKQLWQDWGIPPWLRDRVPFFYDGDVLKYIFLPDGRLITLSDEMSPV